MRYLELYFTFASNDQGCHTKASRLIFGVEDPNDPFPIVFIKDVLCNVNIRNSMMYVSIIVCDT